MKFVLLFVAAAAAIKLDAVPIATPAADAQKARSASEGEAQHAGTMQQADFIDARSKAGVAASAADIGAYKTAHGCNCND